jgi:anti-sigma regulatory factor (Ser/Thr protein kinase)
VNRVRRFRNRPESVPAARRFVRSVLSEQSADTLDAVELMASELATNCVNHAQTCFEFTIEEAKRQIRVEVRDTGPGRPEPRSPTPSERTGRGLRIVEAMSETWGIELSPSGKTVWFTVPQQARA